MASLPSRIAGRLLTGPFAFFLAGTIDIVAYALRALVTRTRRRVSTMYARWPLGGS